MYLVICYRSIVKI